MPLVDFIGIGAPRAATTWLHHCLREHPEIFVPRHKELHFFSDYTLFTTTNRVLGNAWYARQFKKGCLHRIRGEVSPSYLIDPAAAERIHTAFPACKIIVQFRDPVEALYSSYRLGSCFYNMDANFETFLAGNPRFKDNFLYAPLLRRYLALFPREQVHAIFFEDIVERPADVLAELYTFLGVTPHNPRCLHETVNSCCGCRSVLLRGTLERAKRWLDASSALERCYKGTGFDQLGKRIAVLNSRSGTVPPMPPALERDLRDFYRAPNEELGGLLGRDLSHWNRA